MQHRSRVHRDPDQPNLRQVHLIADELLDELRAEGYEVSPGRLGENVTTRGSPPASWAACLSRDPDGALVRRAGVMGVVLRGGAARTGDAIEVAPPPGPPEPLQPV